MQLSLQICLFLTALICYTDTAPRRSWGSFAQLLENNRTTELCTKGQCVHWAECKVFADVSSRSKACSNKHGGPWVCCLDLTGEGLELSKTKDKSMIVINELENSNIPINDHSRSKSEIISHKIDEQNSSSPSIVDKSEEKVFQQDETYASEHIITVPTNLSSTSESTQNEVVIVPLDAGHLLRNSSLSVESFTIQNPNVDLNDTYIPRNPFSVLKNIQNETSIAPLDKNGGDQPKNTSIVFEATQNETAIVTVNSIHDLDPSRFVPDGETSDVSDVPIAERQVRYPMRSEWEEVHGNINRYYPNSNYYSRRRTGKTSPPLIRKSTWNNWNEDYDIHQQGISNYRDVKTTSRSWGRPTKKIWTTIRPTNLERKHSTLSRRVIEDSWRNGPTSSDKTTKGWRNPTPSSRNKPYTAGSASVEHRTTLSLRKPTTISPSQNLTQHLHKRSTAIRKTTTTAQSWIKPTRQPDYRDASVYKIMNSGEHSATDHSRSKPASWNKNTTTPSWSISTGMWSGRRIPIVSTRTSRTTKPVLKSTTAAPRRTITSRSPATKSTTTHRQTSTTKPAESNTVTGINIHMCGIRQDGTTVTSRRGRSLHTEHHPDSISIYPNSQNNPRARSFQRIVGGTEAEPFTWPWVAALYKVTSTGGNRFLSAGSLINENFVLTAAHVFTPEDLSSASFVVMLGTHTAKEAVAEYPVMSVLRHPQYQQRFYYNDIALLRLVKPVVFNNYVMPVCLPSFLMTDDDLIGTRVTVMGWGDESYGGITSRVLKEATLPIVSRQTCNASYIRVASNRFPKGITTNMLCAGAPDGGKDACQGDSGGPLTTTRNGRHILLGIVSFGYRCGDKEYPGVYTRVASYLNWIADNGRYNGNHYYDDDYYVHGR